MQLIFTCDVSMSISLLLYSSGGNGALHRVYLRFWLFLWILWELKYRQDLAYSLLPTNSSTTDGRNGKWEGNNMHSISIEIFFLESALTLSLPDKGRQIIHSLVIICFEFFLLICLDFWAAIQSYTMNRLL